MTDEKFKSDESGLLLVYMQPGPNVTLEEFHEWYDNEHVPLRIQRFTTFKSAVRYNVADTTTFSAPSVTGEMVGKKTDWGAFYTVSSNATFSDPLYTSLRSERSEREAELFTRLAIVDRRIYKLEYDSDTDPNITTTNDPERKKLGLSVQRASDTPRYLVANSVDMKPELQQEYDQWFDTEHAPMLSAIPGWKRSRRFRLIDNGVNGTQAKQGDAETVPKTLGLHEYDNDSPEETDEYRKACSTPWRARLVGENNANVIRRERKVCKVYRAWDPIAALQYQQQQQ